MAPIRILEHEFRPPDHVCGKPADGWSGPNLGSVEKGYWYARSTEFLGLPYMPTLRWLRVPGDAIFAIASLVLVAFAFAGRSGSARRSEEPLPHGVRVPAGD
jgi:hypothetical protein